jgi:hypothetical protein
MKASLAKEYDRLRNALLKLDGVSPGEKFGGEAFFFGKRFLCHIHRGNGFLFLETFVRNKVDEVMESVPGAAPHPRYGGYGWVRFKVSSSGDLGKAKRLIEMSYDYMVRTKRVFLPRTEETRRLLKSASIRFPAIRFEAKDSLKRTQVIMEVQRGSGSVQSHELLDRATMFLRQS